MSLLARTAAFSLLIAALFAAPASHTTALLLRIATLLAIPFVLPQVVIQLRFWLFTAINGDEGVQVPNDKVSHAAFRLLYAHPAARLRSTHMTDIGLSDIFWYFLAPAHYIHQEHVESDVPIYQTITTATKRVLNQPREKLADIARRHTKQYLNTADICADGSWHSTRLRDFFFPLFTTMLYELVFGDATCPAEFGELSKLSAENIVSALKCTTMRDMRLRAHLTNALEERILGGACADIFDETNPEAAMSAHEKALHLQGVFFHTGAVQMCDAMSHLVLAIAQHPEVQRQLWKECARETGDGSGQERDDYVDRVIHETLRVWPLFGIAHRITSDRVSVQPDGEDKPVEFPKGTVLCFSYPDFHSGVGCGLDNPTQFIPDRFLTVSRRDTSMSFGAPRNRPCPAERLALIWMRVMIRELVRRRAFFSVADHTRSLPCRGPCIMALRSPTSPTDDGSRSISAPVRAVVLAFMWVRDRVEACTRSVAQLVYGTYMMWDARNRKLAHNFLRGSTEEREVAKMG